MILMLGQRWLTGSTDILAAGCGLGKGFHPGLGEKLLTFASVTGAGRGPSRPAVTSPRLALRSPAAAPAERPASSARRARPGPLARRAIQRLAAPAGRPASHPAVVGPGGTPGERSSGWRPRRNAPRAIQRFRSLTSAGRLSRRAIQRLAGGPTIDIRCSALPESRELQGVLKCGSRARTPPSPWAAEPPAAYPSSRIVTEVIATGLSGRSRLLRGALAIWSTTSRPFVTWPKIV